MSDAVPLIDLTAWYAGDAVERAKVARDTDEALRTMGFLLITGHRLGTEVTEEVRAAARRFFALPPEVKARYATVVGGRGFLPAGVEANAASDGVVSPPDLKESFTSGRADIPESEDPLEAAWYSPNVWPVEVVELRDATTAFAAACDSLADDLLEIFGMALDLPADYFTSRCDTNPYTVNLNWYPPMSHVGEVLDGQFRIGQHTDFGTLTVLDREPGYGGLQVRTVAGEWVDAPFVPGALTINSGDLLARWTGDRWRSTPHRVLPPPENDTAEDLLSLVFFHEANPLAIIETLPTAAAGRRSYEPVTAGAFLRQRLDSISVS